MLKNKRKEYYFKFTNANINNQVCEFTGVEWLNGMPGSRLKTGNLYEFDLKLLKQPGKSVVTLGDNQLLYNEAKYFRRAIARENPVNFKEEIKTSLILRTKLIILIKFRRFTTKLTM